MASTSPGDWRSSFGFVPGQQAGSHTGNRQDATAASYLEPLVAPAPVGLNTLLARCLVQGTDADGRHAFATYPQAVGWLLEAAASGGGLTAIEEAERAYGVSSAL